MNRIRLISTCFCLLTFSLAVGQPNQLTPSDTDSKISFKIKNLGLTVDGDFKGLTGSIQFNAANPLDTKVDVSVDASTINTGIEARDGHLSKQDYFDVKNYPLISFKSSKVVNSTKAGTYFIYGVLSIKKTQKEISFPFEVSELRDGYLFKGKFNINRRGYEVGGNSMTLGDNVNIELSVFSK